MPDQHNSRGYVPDRKRIQNNQKSLIMLQLERPIIFFDLETTGTSIIHDRIVQIAAIKINIDGSEEEKKTLVNPCIPIPKDATEVHGITDDMVEKAPTFTQISKSLFNWMKDCDLAGYNSDNFDVPLLSEEFNRCKITFPVENTCFIDVLKIERLVNSHKLENAYKRYTGNDLDGAHDALFDTRATKEVLYAQIEKFGLNTLPADLEKFGLDGKERVDLSGKLYKNESGEICYSFGKSKDIPVKIDPGFGQWMLRNDFPSDTKRMIIKILNER